MAISVESQFGFGDFRKPRHSGFNKGEQLAARIQDASGRASSLMVRSDKKSGKKANTTLLCRCQHAKSIHSRMYANQKLGTACNFPACSCKAYKAK